MGVVTKDLAHDLGLRPVDGAVAMLGFAVHRDPGRHVIAVGIAARELAVFDPALLAAMGVDADVAQQDLVHRALHADQHGINLALGQGLDLDAPMFYAFMELGNIGKLARQPVHGLGQNDVELARCGITLQRLDPRGETCWHPRWPGHDRCR